MYNVIQDLLSAYRSTPETLQALLRNYPPVSVPNAGGGEGEWSVFGAGWVKTGDRPELCLHPAAGPVTIRGQIAHLVAHDAIHLAQISRQLMQEQENKNGSRAGG